ncbi:Serine/threonine-protein kinase PknB [Aquisphaera giovannonii]|uniref:Serine/threonine-protein kinase PknB n=1 Tax=Aquisphaera giovannonii TaxID=406548 RepID=A0A5B9W342_9BACT|nr:SUMF1/EgtB/PvdO family nonheme iron enzyme [Aquisphaera giovannonii]QEH34654.1 Serine/threonine-protein kinase PknB [Aquisphaera giovannonii]
MVDPWFDLTTQDRLEPLGEPTRALDQESPRRERDPEPPPRPAGLPRQVGRYRVVKLVGQGGFGLVCEAYDEQLKRRVALKLPHPHLVASQGDAELYLAEARMVAGLDHPGIVPVYDVGSTAEHPCYVVSKLIDGQNLAARMRRTHVTPSQAAELVARVAEALHHAHGKGLVHRDVKPGNILIDGQGRPYVVDFGLALRDQDVGKGSRYAGTPAYMSPEQAWGEGHRVDGRSDIFSLAVVFYELLTRRRPFRGEGREALLEQVTRHDPRPPRQVDESIPRELDRICLKALSKRASERYSTAMDMAEDLRLFLEKEARRIEEGEAAPPPAPSPSPPPPPPLATPMPPSRDSLPLSLLPVNIVPRGLRSFESRDSDFFLALLPGPRDREGLPESLRFWKTWVEAEADRSCPVGLIYGPSGCGKSSLVKAGLLPSLSRDVLKVYIEATPGETEARLLNSLRKQVPALGEALGLRDSLAAIRQGRLLPAGRKVLIVLDQFEQWLHARREDEGPALVQAMRQCDGERVCCIAMVRDDFWMAATRFMKAIEVRIVEGRNSMPVDLFDLGHAERVLAAYGRAYGRISGGPARRQREQAWFLREAVAGLAQDGKVVCVRLALLAEMMKDKPWTRSALAARGGTRGVGFAFLEENFGDAAARPEHRYHRKAARAVLAALLPGPGADIKGHMRSLADLREASGYAARPQDFEDLIRIFDLELRLISPTDPEGTGAEGPEPAASRGGPGGRYYQLTHDYLVHSLRDWLTHKKRETATGRAELCLEDRARLWESRPEGRSLPSFLEWLRIHAYTRAAARTAPQRAMLRRADIRYAAIGALCLAAAGAATWGGYEAAGRFRAGVLVGSLPASATSQHPSLKARFAAVRRWAGPQLRQILGAADPASQEYLHASLLLVDEYPSRVGYLGDRLLAASPGEVAVLREALAPHVPEVIARLRSVLETARPEDERLLPAAAALAGYRPDDPAWDAGAAKVARALLVTSPASIGVWIEEFRPIAARLSVPLQALFHARDLSESERVLASTVLASYAADPPRQLAGLLMDADPRGFAILLAAARRQEARITPLLEEELARRPSPGDRPAERTRLAARQARAATALYLFGRPDEVLSRLRHSPDPQLRSDLIVGLRPMGADPRTLLDAANELGARARAAPAMEEASILDPTTSTRRALILALGHYDPAELGEGGPGFIERLVATYREDPDAGIHGAADWALRRWGLGVRLDAIDGELGKAKAPPGRGWSVNSQGQTFALVRGPVEFVMGSPPEECRQGTLDIRHRRLIPRGYAIGLKEVSLAEFQRFLAENPGVRPNLDRAYAPELDGPMSGVSWFDAAAYCNWLSRKEGLREYYEPNSQGWYGPGMRVRADAESRDGYRLPTEAEWEFAGRAGAATARYYGSADDLLTHYAWGNITSDGHAWPRGRLLPNDLGLFDTLGNVYEWCEDRRSISHEGPQEPLTVDRLDPGEVVERDQDCMIRGGGFVDVARDLRMPQRAWNRPINQLGSYGFRIARTLVSPPAPIAGR